MPPVRARLAGHKDKSRCKRENAARARVDGKQGHQNLVKLGIQDMPPVREAEKLGEVGLKKRKQRKSSGARRLIL